MCGILGWFSPSLTDRKQTRSGYQLLQFLAPLSFFIFLCVLLSKKSPNPVLLGRYSWNLLSLIVTASLFYGCYELGHRRGLRYLGNTYAFVGTMLLSCVIVLFLINQGCVVVNHYLSGLRGRGYQNHEEKLRVLSRLTGFNFKEIEELRMETEQPLRPDLWVGFKERPRSGRFVNVSVDAYRKTIASLEGSRHLILMFGGSTTFGVGVSDSQTIPTYLQQSLNAAYGMGVFCVRNYGTSAYNSKQEYLLLFQLLEQGVRSQVAIFLDGYNEGPITEGSRRWTELLNEQLEFYPNLSLSYFIRKTPAYQLYSKVFTKKKKTAGQVDSQNFTDPRVVKERYLWMQGNIRHISGQHQIRPFFFIQPVPGYRNRFRQHEFLESPDRVFLQTRRTVRALSSIAKGGSVVDLSGLLSDYEKQPFVDEIHYTAEVNQIISERILATIQPALDQLVGKESV